MDRCPYCAQGQPAPVRGRDQVPLLGCGLCGTSPGAREWSTRRWPCLHPRDEKRPVEQRLVGLTELYDERTHGPRAFGGDFGGQRVCLLCLLERQRVLLRERAYEISYLVGEVDDARRRAEPAMTERDVLGEQLQAALQRLGRLEGHVAERDMFEQQRDAAYARIRHLDAHVNVLAGQREAADKRVSHQKKRNLQECAFSCGCYRRSIPTCPRLCRAPARRQTPSHATAIAPVGSNRRAS